MHGIPDKLAAQIFEMEVLIYVFFQKYAF